MAKDDSPKAELSALRAEVDEIDQQIILLLGVRFRCTDMIGELKQAHDMDLVDPVREDQQVQRIRRLAEEAGVPPRAGRNHPARSDRYRRRPPHASARAPLLLMRDG